MALSFGSPHLRVGHAFFHSSTRTEQSEPIVAAERALLDQLGEVVIALGASVSEPREEIVQDLLPPFEERLPVTSLPNWERVTSAGCLNTNSSSY